jgi:uncharacterized iron-regulated membrane protein
MDDAGGWMLFIISVIFVAALGAALVYGTLTWRKRRSRGMEQIRDEKTRELYGKRRSAQNQ